MKPIFEIFLNDKFEFKNLGDIIFNQKYQSIDKKISFAFLSCQSFLRKNNLDSLSHEEILLLKEAILYSKNSVNYFNDILNTNSKLENENMNKTMKLMKIINKFVPFSHDSVFSDYQNYKLMKYEKSVQKELNKR